MSRRAASGRYGRRGRAVLLAVSSGFILLVTLAAVAAPLLATHSPTEQRLDDRFESPGRAGHLLGTDEFGRDIYSRIVYGSRAAVVVGLVSVGLGLGLGMLFGLTAALIGGFVDNALMLIVDALLSFPTILLAITVVALLGYGLPQVMLAMGVIFSPLFARLIRAETLARVGEGYLEAARALGTPRWRMIGRHILPNIGGKLAVQSSVIFATSVVVEASLSFLGLGTQPPNPSWGLMLKDARNYLLHAPHAAIYPGVAIALTVLSFNVLGDSLSDLLDPRRS